MPRLKNGCIGSLLATLVSSAYGSPSSANDIQLTVSLNVPDEAVPEYVCFISNQRSKCGGVGPACMSAALGTAEESIAGALPVMDSMGDTLVLNNTNARKLDPPAKKELLGDTTLALSALARDRPSFCPAPTSLCAPSLRLPSRGNYFVRCDRNGIPTNSDRVVFISIDFHPATAGADIRTVSATGKLATLTFRKDVSTKYSSARVVGGDYAFSNEGQLGFSERVQVDLIPNCHHRSVELPPDMWKKTSVTLTLSAGARTHATCRLVDEEALMDLAVPYDASPQRKRIRFEAGRTTMETSWTDSVPPPVLNAGYRTVSFAWKKNCVVTTCPEVALAHTAARCPLSDHDDSRCYYQCSAPEDRLIQLPLDLNFSRRTSDDLRVLYDWPATLRAVDEELDEFVSPSERQLLIRFADPDAWRGAWGNRIDAVEVSTSATNTQRIEMTDGPAHDTFLIAAPGLSCGTTVRVGVEGTHLYPPRALTANSGELVLLDPSEYRAAHRVGLALGFGGSLDQDERMLSVTFAAQVNSEHAAAELTLESSIARLGAPRSAVSDALQYISYYRWTAMPRYTLWLTRSIHMGGGAGLGFGSPWSRHDRLFGGQNDIFAAAEAHFRLRKYTWSWVWFETAVGLRRYLWGQYKDTAVSEPQGDFDVYLMFRARWGAG
jgi:hypothetical protein